MNQNAQVMQAMPERISCLLLSLENRKLLVPVTAVAEVINSALAVEGTRAEGPLYGWIEWRDQRIPLLSLEALTGGARPPLGGYNRVLILNAIGAMAEVGFYAIILQGLPTPAHVTPEALTNDGGADQMLMAECDLGQERGFIPDFGQLETTVASFAR